MSRVSNVLAKSPYRSPLRGRRPEEDLAHLHCCTAYFGPLARPRQGLFQICGFEYQQAANDLLVRALSS